MDDVRYLTDTGFSLAEMYYSYRQFGARLPVSTVTVLVRTPGDPATLAPALGAVIRETDDHLVPEAIVPMEDRILTTLARPRLYAILLGGFAAFALVIAAVGLFSVLSYTVAQRSRELVVRATLGARQIDLVTLILGQGLAMAVAGIAAGLLGSLALMRSIGALLYGITTLDGITYCAVPVVVVLVTAAACLAPACRAARIDPVRALRY